MTTIRAIDTGFGNTKFSMCGTRNPGGLVCHTFPSLVSEPGKGAAGAEVIGGKRNTVQVQVDGQVYEVGPGVEQLMGHRDARSLHRDYARTLEFHPHPVTAVRSAASGAGLIRASQAAGVSAASAASPHGIVRPPRA